MITTERPGEGLAARAGLWAARDLLARRIDAEAVRAAVWPFLATRLAFVVIGLAAPLLFADHATRTPPVPTGSGWLRWDAQWFVGIAEHGYGWTADPAGHFSATAFFPLYPLLTHAFSLAGLVPGPAAPLIANAAFLAPPYSLY